MKKEFLVLAAVAMVMVACGKKSATTGAEGDDRAETVGTMILQPREIQRELSLSSNLQGYQTVNIAPSLQGKIEHIYVEVGDELRAGQSIVTMDEQQYKTTKLQYQNLQTEMARMEGLLQTGSVSKQVYDQTKLGLEQTKESLDFLEKNTYVKAPFAGVIAAKNYEDGELYAGQPIAVLTEVDRLKTLVAIPESYMPQVKKGQGLVLRSSVYPDRDFHGTIEVVYPTVDPSSHTFMVKVVIPNKDHVLRPGMYVTTTLGLGKANVLMAPYSTVLKLIGANDRYVFINENGYAKRVAVEMGQRFGDDVEISGEGIHEGVELIVKGEAKLIDGVAIQVVNE